MTYLILEYEQDSEKDQTFKDDDAHPLIYEKASALRYVDEHEVYGKIFEYDDGEYADYLSGATEEIPEPLDIIEW